MGEVFSVYLPQWELRRDVYDWLDGFERLGSLLNGKVFPMRSSLMKGAVMVVSIAETPEHIALEFKKDPSIFGRVGCSYSLKLDFTCNNPSDDYLEDGFLILDRPEIEPISLWREFLEHELRDEISIFIMALDLTSPGSGYHGRYVLESEDFLRFGEGRSADISGDYEYMRENGINRSPDLDFSLVWKALNATNGLKSGVPDTPFGKVISAITYLYAGVSSSARFFDVVWACYGLEGFFGEGGGSRAKQVEDKVSLFLGLEHDRIRLLLKRLYELRSKFIHGNSAVSSALVEVEPPPGKFSTEEWDAQHVGTYLLLEIARECIRRGISRQEFGLVLK